MLATYGLTSIMYLGHIKFVLVPLNYDLNNRLIIAPGLVLREFKIVANSDIVSYANWWCTWSSQQAYG